MVWRARIVHRLHPVLLSCGGCVTFCRWIRVCVYINTSMRRRALLALCTRMLFVCAFLGRHPPCSSSAAAAAAEAAADPPACAHATPTPKPTPTSTSTPTHYDYIVVGAGSAGLQMGLFLHKAGASYVIYEKGASAATFWQQYPVSQA